MSDIPRLTKKQKKAAAFRDKKGKGKAKHRSEETSHDIPVEENQDLEELSTGFGVSTNAVAEDKISANHIVVEDATAVIGDSGPSKKRKRGDITIEPTGPVAGETQPSAAKRRRQKVASASDDNTAGNETAEGRRYILFLGNLKYTTSREAIENHFSSCPTPPLIRLLTPKPKPGAKPSPSVKSKGCAFLEFQDKVSLQQGLRLHHSVLDGRQINVELTAGGGGKSETRVTKLKERNKELHAQRTKAVENKKKKGEAAQEEDIESLTAGKRYSATSGVEQAPTTKRTWTVGDQEEEVTHRGGVKHTKKRGKRKSAAVKSMASGMNAIPVG